MRSDVKIGFIGGGNMASALIGGLLKLVDQPQQIHVVDLNPSGLQKLQQQFGVSTSEVMDQRLRELDVIVFAVKPQNMREVVQNFSPFLTQQLLLSVAAGIRASDISRWLGGYELIARAMPNTPAMLGLGMSGLYGLEALSAEQRQHTDTIMQAVGKTVWVENEAMIDAVTAVSGSGPAYFFYLLEAMEDAAVALGLSPSQGQVLAIEALQGAAGLARASEAPSATLRKEVTSKGGTTEAAMHVLEKLGAKDIFIRAIKAAAWQSKVLCANVQA